MKILGTIIRFLCALLVLLALAVYLDGSLQASLTDYFRSFTPEHLMALAQIDGWPAIAAGVLLLLTLCCGIRLGWNIAYSFATFAFFAEFAILALGPELALPTAIRGLGWEQLLRETALNYPVPALMIPAFCILGCILSCAPVRIAFRSLINCALCYGFAELLYFGVQQWQGMEAPFLPRALALVQAFPWVLVAIPAVFFLQYCFFMAIFDTFACSKKKAEKKASKQDEPKSDENKDDSPAEAKSVSAPVVPVAATPVVVKRPIIHKKSPISTTADDTAKKDSPQPEDKKEDMPTEATAPPPPAPKDEEKKDAPKPEEPKPEEPKPEPTKPAEAAGDEPAPASSIPSVPLPPAN